MVEDLSKLPDNLPIPIDDGSCSHLLGLQFPAIDLPVTHGSIINLSELLGWLVVFCYPMVGNPKEPIPNEWNWNEIPGARGCTPQACSYRDNIAELTSLGAQIFGLSSQSTFAQEEASNWLHLPYALISDAELKLTKALNLPTFNIGQLAFNKRVTIMAYDGVIKHYFYPVFPPDRDVNNVLSWLSENA